MRDSKCDMSAPGAEAEGILPEYSTVDLLQVLIDRVTTCKRVFDLAHMHRTCCADDVVFVDEHCCNDRTSWPEDSAVPASNLAAHYCAMLRATLNALQQFRRLQREIEAAGGAPMGSDNPQPPRLALPLA
ncbi:MAG: hypothetical protein AB7K35_10720 [Pseudorhodoplanes sp.]